MMKALADKAEAIIAEQYWLFTRALDGRINDFLMHQDTGMPSNVYRMEHDIARAARSTMTGVTAALDRAKLEAEAVAAEQFVINRGLRGQVDGFGESVQTTDAARKIAAILENDAFSAMRWVRQQTLAIRAAAGRDSRLMRQEAVRRAAGGLELKSADRTGRLYDSSRMVAMVVRGLIVDAYSERYIEMGVSADIEEYRLVRKDKETVEFNVADFSTIHKMHLHPMTRYAIY